MTLPLWCVVIVAFLPYPLAIIGTWLRVSSLGSFNNNDPRDQYAQLEGIGKRAYAAQLNAWEVIGVFSVSVFVAHLAGADGGQSAIAAVIFVITRILHPVFYMADLATFRSMIFVVGNLCCMYLVYLAAVAG